MDWSIVQLSIPGGTASLPPEPAPHLSEKIVPSSLHVAHRPWFLGAPGGRLRRIGLLAAVIVAALMWAAVAPARAADPVIAASADIACDTTETHFNGGAGTIGFCNQLNTSNLLPGASAVLPVGDLQYECGGLAAFNAPGAYNSTWGRFKSLTFPVPGNHEYYTSAIAPTGTGCDDTGQAKGYFDYFPTTAPPTAAAVKGKYPSYYSYNIGTWHLIALNSNCGPGNGVGGCGPNAPQEKWLKKDLATNTASCTLAYMHHSLFSSKTPVNSPRTFWQDLYGAGAEIVLGGHVHAYERFAPQTPLGAPDPSFGIRQFVVGTGGRSLEAYTTVAANSEVRGRSFGVLKLTLHANSYDWEFARDPRAGNPAFADSGTATCHGIRDTVPPTVSVTAPANGAIVSGAATISANAADPSGINRVDFLVDGTNVGTDTTAPYSVLWDTRTIKGGLHSVTARAFDLSGNQASASVTVTVNNFVPVLPGAPPGAPRASTDIYRVRVDGAGKRRVTTAPVNVDYDNPAWSRSGRLIAFSGTCPGCPGGIFVTQPGGGGQRQLASAAAGATRPDWGRLDRALTFVGGPTGAVYTITSRGTGQRRLTSGSIGHDQSVWSPDGRQIAFTTQQRNGGWEILTMRANGTGKRNLTRTLGATELQPAWSHDGRQIAFTRRIGSNWAIFVMPATGGRARRITSPALNCQQPAWSPNGRQIACARFTDTGSKILLLRANGTVLRKLNTGTATAWAPTWSPDGRRIAFVSIG